jgi:hypothetical protein
VRYFVRYFLRGRTIVVVEAREQNPEVAGPQTNVDLLRDLQAARVYNARSS